MSEPRSRDIVRADGHVTAADRERVLGHRPATLWLTGLSGSGKSTLAFALEQVLVERGVAAYVLDGDNVRFGLNRDLGHAPEDRTENVRRVGEVCRLMADAGLVVLAAFISPYRADRDHVRRLHPEDSFFEVFLDAPIEECERRDVKGLYSKARSGAIPGFTGVGAPYEAPTDPEIRVPTGELDLASSVALVLDRLVEAGIVPGHARA